ncbi:hypothetical protein OROMI_002503 [Orobanche minor]
MRGQKINSKRRKSYAAMDVERKAALLHSRRVKYSCKYKRRACLNCHSPCTFPAKMHTAQIFHSAWYAQQNREYPLACLVPSIFESVSSLRGVLYLREPKGFCCLRGQISLPLPRMPLELWNLYTSLESSDAVHFWKRCRTYNNTTAFSSLGITYDETFAKSNKGVYTLRIQGAVYHFIRDLIPTEGPGRQLQLYFYEPENELQNRLSQSGDLQLHILQHIVELMSAAS